MSCPHTKFRGVSIRLGENGIIKTAICRHCRSEFEIEYPYVSGKNEYRYFSIGGAFLHMHQVVWGLLPPGEKPNVVHHINGIKGDNRPCNLVALAYSEHHNGIHTNTNTSHIMVLKERIRELELEVNELNSRVNSRGVE